MTIPAAHPAYDIHPGNVTEKVIASFRMPSARDRQLLAGLITHLHAFARENQLTHAEWAGAIAFLFRCGEISSDKRDEFMLLSDVFYASDSPLLPMGADLRASSEDTALLVRGVVRSTHGDAAPGASIDMWQTNINGLYATQDDSVPDDALRCKMHCAPDGAFHFTTVLPGPYRVPDDGPVGELLRAGGRTAWRPAHFHFLLRAEGHRPITTEIFIADDPYLGSDAVFGVRKSLIVAPRLENGRPVIDLAFTLAPETA
jgi:hydroxyquinol 1,2-dioxygenase